MKIILTGSNGNLGSQIIAQNHEHEILPIHRHNWDDLAGLSLEKEFVVIHAASDLTSKLHERPSVIVDSNLATTTRLLEISRECRSFIYISSCAVYGDALTTSESIRCQPLSINGITKLLNEKIIEEFCEGNGIPYLILRVFNTYGGRDHFSIISKLQHAVRTGSAFQLNNLGVAQRDFVHVSDVAAVILRLIKLELPSGRINIGTGCTTRISEIVGQFRKCYPDIRIVDRSANEVEYSRADITKLMGMINFNFSRMQEKLPELIATSNG
jgi:nucleoside-diphosphate-sugar epimerase